MFTLYDNIKRLCDAKGVSPSKMCLDIGKSKSLISSLRNGKTTGINKETANAMAEYFGVSVDEVLHGIRKDPSTMSDEGVDKELNEIFTALKDRPEMRALLNAAKGASASNVQAVADMLLKLKGGD